MTSPSSLATSALLTHPSVTPGASYTFRVRAKNLHGWGPWTAVPAIIKAAEKPAAPLSAPTTSIDAATGGVEVSWTAPGDGSDTITVYEVEVRDSLGNWIADPVGCGGTPGPTDATIVTQESCILPMTELSGTLGLPFDSLVEVKFAARNSYGLGADSPVNTVGARTRRAPDQMTAPLQVAVTEA